MAFETEKDLTPEEEPVTSRDESGEPSGEEDPANEEERIVDDQPQDYLAMAQRIQAVFENSGKRVGGETAAAGERARSGLVRELLPIVDNLERALASAEDGEQHLA